jgi:hypothetical protein
MGDAIPPKWGSGSILTIRGSGSIRVTRGKVNVKFMAMSIGILSSIYSVRTTDKPEASKPLTMAERMAAAKKPPEREKAAHDGGFL